MKLLKYVSELSPEVVPGPAPGAEAAAAQSPAPTFDELGGLSGTQSCSNIDNFTMLLCLLKMFLLS